jgi:hypothetical protein
MIFELCASNLGTGRADITVLGNLRGPVPKPAPPSDHIPLRRRCGVGRHVQLFSWRVRLPSWFIGTRKRDGRERRCCRDGSRGLMSCQESERASAVRPLAPTVNQRYIRAFETMRQ